MSFALTVIVLGHALFNSIPNTCADQTANAIATSIAIAIPNASQSTRRPDYTYIPGIGSHKVHRLAKPWDDAKKICEGEGGGLSIINSDAEATIIGELIKLTRPHINSHNSEYAHIGYTDREREGQYLTLDGRRLSAAGYERWAAGEPNDGGDAWSTDDCGAINIDGLLVDANCIRPYAFVCELPGAVEGMPTL